MKPCVDCLLTGSLGRTSRTQSSLHVEQVYSFKQAHMYRTILRHDVFEPPRPAYHQ